MTSYFTRCPGPYPWYDPYASYGAGALSDVTPLGVAVPSMGIAQAFGIAPKGFGSFAPKGSASGSVRPGPAEFAPSASSKTEIPWFGIAVIVGVGALGALLIYSGSRAAEKYVGPIHKQAGRATGSMLKARYGRPAIGGLGAGDAGGVELLPARRDYKLLTA